MVLKALYPNGNRCPDDISNQFGKYSLRNPVSPVSYDPKTLIFEIMSLNVSVDGRITMTPALNLSGGNVSGAAVFSGIFYLYSLDGREREHFTNRLVWVFQKVRRHFPIPKYPHQCTQLYHNLSNSKCATLYIPN